MPDSIAISLILLLFLTTSLLSALATTECPADVSYPITVTLDKGKLFSECAQSSASVRVDVRSLFDVLSFSERDFLIFCRSSDCIKPVKALLQVTPTSCLITYQLIGGDIDAVPQVRQDR